MGAMAPSVGNTASLRFPVTEDDTAIALGSGDVPVLATPRLVAWCEAATVAAVAAGMDEGATSVGTKVAIDHLAPTPVGGSVDIVAIAVAVDGRQLTFDVSATDDNGRIGGGTITRAVVDRRRFLDRVNSRR